MFVPLILFVVLAVFVVGKIEERWYIPDLGKILITLYTLLALCTYLIWAIPFVSEKFPL
jgi:hypothetical protein